MKKIKRRIQLLGLVSLLCFSLSCVSLSYYHRLAEHQTYILRAKVSITDTLNDPSVDIEIKNKLRLVLEVRDFAKNHLGLDVKNNYLSYVPLKNTAVSFVVNASQQYELENYYWSYPIVGRLPYRGYPTQKEAHIAAKNLEQKGYDVFVRGVNAYSTLGWFDDPVFSSMLSLNEERLVETIIHESVHATVFYKDDADFNERLATYLGLKGAKLFYQFKKNPHMVEKILNNKKQALELSAVMLEEIKSLKKWYKDKLTEVEDLAEKESLKKQRLQKIEERLYFLGLSSTKNLHLNNARLMLFSTYRGAPEDFDQLYQRFQSFKELMLHLKSIKHSKDLAML